MVILLLLVGSFKREKVKWAAFFTMIFWVGAFFIGASHCYKEQEFEAAYEPALQDGMRLQVQGVLKEKEVKNHTYQYYLADCYIKLPQGIVPCNQIILQMDIDCSTIGRTLILEGEVTTFRQARNEGNFDEKSFYQSQKIAFKMKNPKIKNEYGETNRLKEWLFALRERLKQVFEACLQTEESGVLVMMTLGDKSVITQEVKELYQKVGISHVLSISGLHISVIGMGIYKWVRRICGNYFISAVFAGGFMLLYVCMVSFSPSATRAVIMFLVMLLAELVGRSYDSLSALSLAALLLLWDNTNWIYHAGFVLSFSAVIGVVWVGGVLGKTLKDKPKLLKTFYSNLAIQLVTVPLTAYYFYEVSVYSMLVNLAILPFMSAILFIGLIGGLVGLFYLEAAGWILYPCSLILGFFEWISETVKALPGAVAITGQPSLERMAVYYGILFVMVLIIAKIKKQYGFGIIGFLLLLWLLWWSRETGTELMLLDVGQGDGIYLRTSEGTQLFVDGGSTDVSKVGTYRILPFLKAKGANSVDYWFVSHVDKDHISGLQEILASDYDVEHLVFSEHVVKDESYATLVELAEHVGTEVIYMSVGDCLHMGEAKLTCLYPMAESEDKNANSLVLLYEEGGFSAFLGGDIGIEQEKTLAELYGLEGITFYKVSHHGSKNSNGNQILEEMCPEIAVVSCGENNSYGHPNPVAIERIKGVGTEIFYTMKAGQVTVKWVDGEVWVEEYVCEK